MNIGIDIDGVLTDVRKFTIEEGLKYCEENQKGKLVNPDAYSSEDVFDWDEETDLDFWKKNIFKYAETNPVIDGAANNIKKLKADGHKLYIITARWLASPKTKKYFGQAEDMVEQCLKYDTEESWTYGLSREYLLEHAQDWYNCNEMLKQECPKYNIRYIDTSKNRLDILKTILNEISEVQI